MTATGRSQSGFRATMFYLTGRWPRLWPITRLVNGSASGGHKANETREKVKCPPLWSSAERGAFLRLWPPIWSGLSDCLRHSVRVSTDKCHGLSGRHCSDCARHPRRDPQIVSIRLDQAFFGVHMRSALTRAFAISMSLRMTATMATFAGFPAARRASYLALSSGLNRIATSAGI